MNTPHPTIDHVPCHPATASRPPPLALALAPAPAPTRAAELGSTLVSMINRRRMAEVSVGAPGLGVTHVYFIHSNQNFYYVYTCVRSVRSGKVVGGQGPSLEPNRTTQSITGAPNATIPLFLKSINHQTLLVNS